MPVIQVFHIAKRSHRVDVHPAFRQPLFSGFNFFGRIPAVHIINQRPERGVQTVDVLPAAAVEVVIYRDKPHVQERKDPGDVVPNCDIVPAKAGNISLC